MLDDELNAAWNNTRTSTQPTADTSLLEKIYTVFNLATWLGIVKFKELNISEFRLLNFDYINYH